MEGVGISTERALRTAYARRPSDVFRPPSEAPVFWPTPDQFADPLAYIASIRAEAEPYGICRIKPPNGWKPPFALDVDSLRFVPRVQRLQELEGLARLRLHFLDRLARFWQARGKPLRAPVHEGRSLDLFSLFHAVELHGGLRLCNLERRWPAVLEFLGYPHSYAAVAAVKNNYEKILTPFQDFLKSKTSDSPAEDKKPEIKKEDPDEPPIKRERSGMRSLRKMKNGFDIRPVESVSKKCSRELQRLTVYGAGHKFPGCEEAAAEESRKRKLEIDPLAVHLCSYCDKENMQDQLIVCEGCNRVVHAFCVKPPFANGTPATWQCESCLADLLLRPMEPFGFAQAEKEYSLQEFGEMADTFKSNHFKMPVLQVPIEVAEREFWRLVSDPEEDVIVEYGADLHSMDHGSGFPTKSSINVFAGDQEYVDSEWNLNNLPVANGSVLRFINDDISGMTVPWMYVGMCFSAFCWHNEDHWSYSINYLHWGEPKTWYGVPGSRAELLEESMKKIAPELFKSQPDLLHQLVTMMNPNILSDYGVPIYRTDQRSGEFVITFPRSYHTGFNQGYNFAEAVNFAPPDWLSIGRECVLHYKSLKRFCVFSHEELICKIGLAGDELELSIVIPTYKELVIMIETEASQRGAIAKWGVRKSMRKQFELLQDDERFCEVCKTTCFLSALACEKCTNMVCLEHAKLICECGTDSLVLHYRYNLDELHIMIQTLKTRIQRFDKWMSDVKNILKPGAALIEREIKLKSLIDEARSLKIPKCKLLEKLKNEHNKLAKPPEPIIIELDD